MRLAEGLRKSIAIFGGVLFMAVSTFPLIGGAAKRSVQCRGREFTGHWDDCFSDQLPFFEMAAPFVALLLLWPFLRFGFSLWAPDPQFRTQRWRLANEDSMRTLWPALQLGGMALAAWCFYRAALYPIDPVTAPYQLTWIVFGVWALVGAAQAPRSRRLELFSRGFWSSSPSSMICARSSSRFSWMLAITGPIGTPISTSTASDS